MGHRHIPPLTFFNLQTTGLEPVKNAGVPLYGTTRLEAWHTPIEIGWVTLRQKNDESHSDWLILQKANLQIELSAHDLKVANKKALEINAYWERREAGNWSGALVLEGALRQFIEQCAGSILVAKNSCFEEKFLEASLAKAHIPYKEFQAVFHYRVLDINSIALGKLLPPGTPYTPELLNEIPRLLGMEPEPKPCTALGGAEQACKMYIELAELSPQKLRSIRRRITKILS